MTQHDVCDIVYVSERWPFDSYRRECYLFINRDWQLATMLCEQGRF